MLRDMILDIFGSSWPTIVICVIILSSIRITYLILKKQKLVLYKEITYLLFVIYILSLFYIVTFQDINYGTNNFIPFKEIFRYEITSKAFFKNIIGNILLFMPFGLFVTAYLDTRKVYITLVLTYISSLSIEVVQFLIGRIFDIDDIILNLIGGLLGGLLYIILDSIRDNLPSVLKKDWFMNLVIILVLLIVIIYFTGIYKVILL